MKEGRYFYQQQVRYIITNYFKRITKIVSVAKIANTAIDINKILQKEQFFLKMKKGV